MTASVGDWRIPFLTEVQALGSGTQGRVVLARDDESGEVVAVKYLARELLGDPNARATFRAEAQMLTRVRDPHVARLRGYVEAADGAAIVMEAVHGQPLRTLLDDRGALAPEAALAILKGSLLGLAAAHSVGVVHRDYKPTNVMVDDNGHSKLIDFGIAVLSGQSGVSGTPAYMAPELWHGQPASPATDLYSASCVFFECVSGERPFRADTLEAWRTQHTAGAVPLTLLPDSLRPLVLRGMASEPSHRFQRAEDFLTSLESAAAGAYGPDWEQRGWYALGASVALFTAAFPVSLIGGASASAGTLGTSAGGMAANTATTVGHTSGGGVLGKVGGAKGVAGGTTAIAGAAVVATLLWPSGPEVGGEATGSVRLSFARPDVLMGQPNMPASETPYAKLDFFVSPAKIKPGTTVTMRYQTFIRFVNGAKYLPGGRRQCFGRDSDVPGVDEGYGFQVEADGPKPPKDKWPVWFFKTSKSQTNRLPEGPAIFVLGSVVDKHEAEPYVMRDCASHSFGRIDITFTLPDTDELKPGTYLISSVKPLRFTKARLGKRRLSMEAVGAQAQGTLPAVTIFWD